MKISEVEIISKLKFTNSFLDLLKEPKINEIVDNSIEKKNSDFSSPLLRFFFLMKDLKEFYTADARVHFLGNLFVREDLVEWFRFFQNKYLDLLEFILKGYFSQNASSLFQRITDFLEALIAMGETLYLVADELTKDAMHEIPKENQNYEKPISQVIFDAQHANNNSKENQDLVDLYYKQREIAISQFSLLYESDWLYYDLGVSGLPTDCRELQKRYPFPLNKKKVKENKAEFAQFTKKYSINEEKNLKAWDNLQEKVHFYDLW